MYEYYLANPDIKLTIEEFDRDKEIFVEVDPELLWLELDDKEWKAGFSGMDL